jgi:hypothetical protein
MDLGLCKDGILVVTSKSLMQLSLPDFKLIKKQDKETTSGSHILCILPNALLLADRL